MKRLSAILNNLRSHRAKSRCRAQVSRLPTEGRQFILSLPKGSTRTGLVLLRSILAPCALALSACGLHPMYAGGAGGAVSQGLASVDVPPIEGKAGWLVRNALVDRLGAGGRSGPARYRLDEIGRASCRERVLVQV